jgi:hypothetical protein
MKWAITDTRLRTERDFGIWRVRCGYVFPVVFV